MKKMFGLLTITILFISCSKENDTSKDVVNLTNLDKYQKLADAIDNVDARSKASVEEQMASYLDDKYDKNFHTEFAKAKNKQKSSLFQKGASTDETIDLDKLLDEAAFTEVQKEFVKKSTALYPLDDSDKVTKTDSLDVEKIKLGLLNVRGEVTEDIRLNAFQKEQLYTYIDLQYVTLGSVINYVEKVGDLSNNTTKKFSFRKMINQVFSIVVGVAVGAVLGSAGGVPGSIAGAVVIGGGVAYDVFHNNTCIKICGIGSCNTGFFSCK